MSEYVAVEGCKLAFKTSSFSGDISINSEPSKVVKCGGKNSFIGSISFNISGFNGGAITNKDGKGQGSIQGSTSKCTSGNNPMVLENDSVSVIISGTAGEGQSKHPESVKAEVYVKKAGQTVCKMT